MKQALLLLLGITATTIAQAQVPVNRTMAMVQKATATWCGPCGTWGWDLQEEIAGDNMVGATPNAFVFESHGSLGAFHTGTADSMTQSWIGTSVPKWAVNNINRTVTAANGGIYTTTTRTDIKKAVDSLAAMSPVASSGFYYSINGNIITFNTKTTFWKATTGTYAIGAYIIEDSAYGEQIGQAPANSSVYHRNVLRGRISKEVFGDQIATGSIGANVTIGKNYKFTITRTDWDKTCLRFFTVIWKKNGADWNSWEVVNVNNQKSVFTAVGEVPPAVDQLIVYPNPAADRVHISGVFNVAGDARISIINAIGQVVYEKAVPYRGGQLAEDLQVNELSNGVYTLFIRSEGAQTMQKLVVAR